MLRAKEVFVADSACADGKCICNDGADPELLYVIRARNKAVFGKNEKWNVLNHRFRHKSTFMTTPSAKEVEESNSTLIVRMFAVEESVELSRASGSRPTLLML